MNNTHFIRYNLMLWLHWKTCCLNEPLIDTQWGMKHAFINTSNCNLDFSTLNISYHSHLEGLKCYSDGSLCRFNANVLLSCRKTHARTHTHLHIPPVLANCKCWGVECWCMHILSHTAVKLPLKRSEEHYSQALAATLHLHSSSERINTHATSD